ncbi:hypothetical protein E2C01_074389 [Portunus trituberculatus]|uniref:Uncharacterized protein n=1 Tax=Portunus trituberculatus TaxID=210409 RepID=A0A5B7IDE7_PORTR|nr:hypothetical protein [Portunus trituberculatus]
MLQLRARIARARPKGCEVGLLPSLRSTVMFGTSSLFNHPQSRNSNQQAGGEQFMVQTQQHNDDEDTHNETMKETSIQHHIKEHKGASTLPFLPR